MRLLRHDLRLVAGDYHLQRVAFDDKGLSPHQRLAIVVDSAESLATNFDDADAVVMSYNDFKTKPTSLVYGDIEN